MTGQAPAVDPFDAFPDAPADFLATATAHLMLAAEGNDVAGNLDAALRTILTAASCPDTPLVKREAVELARAALASVSEAVQYGAISRLRDEVVQTPERAAWMLKDYNPATYEAIKLLNLADNEHQRPIIATVRRAAE